MKRFMSAKTMGALRRLSKEGRLLFSCSCGVDGCVWSADSTTPKLTKDEALVILRNKKVRKVGKTIEDDSLRYQMKFGLM